MGRPIVHGSRDAPLVPPILVPGKGSAAYSLEEPSSFLAIERCFRDRGDRAKSSGSRPRTKSATLFESGDR